MANDLNPHQLLARRPTEYLRAGFFDPPGSLRASLLGIDAFAVATQLMQGAASPDEVTITYEALRQLVEQQPAGATSQRLGVALPEALQLVRRMLGIENNDTLAVWLFDCQPFVRTDDDLRAFFDHFQAVLRQYTSLLGVSTPPAADAANPSPNAPSPDAPGAEG